MKNPNLTFLNQDLSISLTIGWFVVSVLTLFLFLRATPNRKKTGLYLTIWLVIQSLLAYNGFYSRVIEYPPVLIVGFGIPNLFAVSMLFTAFGKRFIDNLDLKALTYFHVIRLPVELLILWLFIEKQVPELMTFEGRNFDIFSGITAPIVAFLVFRADKFNKKLLLVWNLICLVLLFNIVINALLSAPLPFQQQGFEQPNVGVLKFSAILLPSFIVPLVLFSHLATIKRLLK
jgi:hypothetical protein